MIGWDIVLALVGVAYGFGYAMASRGWRQEAVDIEAEARADGYRAALADVRVDGSGQPKTQSDG